MIPKIKLVRDPETGKIVPEIWRPVVGYEGLYDVSNYGRVKSLEKLIDKGKWGVVKFPEKLLASFLRSTKNPSYLTVNLYKNKRAKPISVHQLVAQSFISNPENKPQVNHKNGIKTYNFILNLEWATSSENTQHSFDNGLQIPLRGEDAGQSKLTEEDVKFIRSSSLKRKELAKMFGVCNQQIDRIINRQRWSHVA